MRTTCTVFSVLAILSALAVNPLVAKDDPIEFLHLLQREGYADVAIDYLEQIKADPSAPKDVLDVWDLEMSRSKRDAADQKLAYDDGQAKQWTEESKALLERFIKSHPNRPEAIQEKARWAEERAVEAQTDILLAGYTAEPAEKEKYLAEARKIFDEIRPQFVQAVDASRKLVASLPKTPPGRREEAIVVLGENRLTLAMIDFYVAQAQAAQRTALLDKLTKDFDAIYQDFRDALPGTRRALLAWRAHFWHARTLQELGRTREALDVYEEVVACNTKDIEDVAGATVAPKGKNLKPTGLEDFFAEVEQYYLQTLYRVNKKDYMEEIEGDGKRPGWRAQNKALSEKCFGYQALTLEYAKNLLEMNKRSPASVAAALKLLREMDEVTSPYQEEAIKLRRQLDPKGSTRMTFEDAVIDGDAALAKKKWAEAADCYEKAIKAKTARTDPARAASVAETLVSCYHALASQLYQENKVDDAVATARKALAAEYRQTKAAPKVAVYLLSILNYQYQTATDDTAEKKAAKAALLKDVTKTANGIVTLWGAREEGDAARIVLMRIAQAQDNGQEADRNLNEINPRSNEYATALTAMGYWHWSKYRAATRQTSDEAGNVKNAKRDEDRRLAVDFTERAVKALEDKDKLRADTAAMPDDLRECKFLLAGIHTEGKDYKQAVSQYKPLLADLLNKDSKRKLDETGLLILQGAGQAFIQLSDLENLTVIGNGLLERGPDQPQVNRAIMGFVTGLDKLRKAWPESDSSDSAAQQEAAAAKLKSLTDLEEKIMINLSKREKLAPNDMTWIAITCANLGTDDARLAATELIKQIDKKANSDKAFHGQVEKVLPYLHSEAAKILAEIGQFDQAQEMIDRLIQAYPNALEPKISEAKILTSWAGRDSSKYAKAILAWDSLRTKLEHSSPKSVAGAPVDPKYEVIVNEADCFLRMAQKTQSKDDAKKGMDLLMPYLNLDPKIRNPDDEYREISTKYYRVGGNLAVFLRVSPPVRPKAKRPPASS